MPHISTYFLFAFVLVVLLLFFIAVGLAPQALAMISGAQKRVSPTTQNKSEVVSGAFRSLGIAEDDLPEVKIYKLFRNFDPLFVNEKVGNKILYQSFILDLKGNAYPYTPLPFPNNTLINNASIGVKDFSKIDSLYQVGNVLPGSLICINQTDPTLDYDNNDCWTSNMDNNLTSMPSNTFKIFVNSNANKFDGKVKIRVGWNYTGSLSGGRKIISVLITLCDG
jgi:hypothetical protein